MIIFIFIFIYVCVCHPHPSLSRAISLCLSLPGSCYHSDERHVHSAVYFQPSTEYNMMLRRANTENLKLHKPRPGQAIISG